MRLRDGESNLLAGLIKEEDREIAKSLPGIIAIPILRSLFGNTIGTNEQSDIIMIVTPHIIRSREITADDLKPLYVGTNTNLGAGSTPSLISPAAVRRRRRPSAIRRQRARSPAVRPPVPPRRRRQAPRRLAPRRRRAPTWCRSCPSKPAGGPPPPAGARVLVQLPERRCRWAARRTRCRSEIEGVSQLGSATVTITYDPKVLSAISVSPGPFMQQGGVQPTFLPKIDEVAGRIDIAIARPVSSPGAAGDGLARGPRVPGRGAGHDADHGDGRGEDAERPGHSVAGRAGNGGRKVGNGRSALCAGSRSPRTDSRSSRSSWSRRSWRCSRARRFRSPACRCGGRTKPTAGASLREHPHGDRSVQGLGGHREFSRRSEVQFGNENYPSSLEQLVDGALLANDATGPQEEVPPPDSGRSADRHRPTGASARIRMRPTHASGAGRTCSTSIRRPKARRSTAPSTGTGRRADDPLTSRAHASADRRRRRMDAHRADGRHRADHDSGDDGAGAVPELGHLRQGSDAEEPVVHHARSRSTSTTPTRASIRTRCRRWCPRATCGRCRAIRSRRRPTRGRPYRPSRSPAATTAAAGIFDVKSGSEGTGLDGSRHADW